MFQNRTKGHLHCIWWEQHFFAKLKRNGVKRRVIIIKVENLLKSYVNMFHSKRILECNEISNARKKFIFGAALTVTVPSIILAIRELSWLLYRIHASGASGGNGVWTMGASQGTLVGGLFHLSAGEHLYILVGQKGTDACTLKVRSKCIPEW